MAKEITKKVAKEGGEKAIKLALKQLGKIVVTQGGEKIAKKTVEGALKKGKEAQSEIENEEGMLAKVKGWFGGLFGGEEEPEEASIDVAAAQKRYGTLVDRLDFNIRRIRGKEEQAKQALLKFIALLMQSGKLKEYLKPIADAVPGINLKDALKKLEDDERSLVLPVLEKNAQAFVNMLKGESLPQESDWFKTLDDQKQQAVQMFVKAYGSLLSEGVAKVTGKDGANLQPELVKKSIGDNEK